MQSRLAGAFIGLITWAAVMFGGFLFNETAHRISLEEHLARSEAPAAILSNIAATGTDDREALADVLGKSSRQSRSIGVFSSGELIAFDRPLSERRIAQKSDPLDPDQPVWPWTDGHFSSTTIFSSDGSDFQLRILEDVDPIQARVSARWTTIAAVIVTTWLFLAGGSYPLARWALRPVKQLGAVAHRISRGDVRARAPSHKGAADLKDLTASFNSIAEQLLASVEREQLFVASASHHFGNLLTPLRIRIESMDRSDSMVQETLVELDRLEMAAERLIQLSQAEEGQLIPVVVDVVPIVEETVESWKPVIDFSKAELRWSLPDSAYAWVIPGALEEILDNLIDNAVKYGNDSVISVRVIRGLSHIRLSVADSGPGLKDDQIEKAYGRFWRGPEHQNQEGSGLGLAIVRALAKRSDSEFVMRNIPGGGLEASLALKRAEHSGVQLANQQAVPGLPPR